MPKLTLHITTINNQQLFEEVVHYLDDNKLGEVMWSTDEGNEVKTVVRNTQSKTS